MDALWGGSGIVAKVAIILIACAAFAFFGYAWARLLVGLL